MAAQDEIRLIPVCNLPEISPGDDLASELVSRLSEGGGLTLEGDVIVVAQKVVSKAEGRLVDLRDVIPSERAMQIARRQDRDARLVEVILSESRSMIREDAHVLITETHHGFICANAGVDRSNVAGDDFVSLLPIDPDRSASRLRARVQELTGITTGVIITDTFGRAWREGLTNVAIGVSGLHPLHDYRGEIDDRGKVLSATVLAVADEIAASTGLLMQKASRIPVVIVRGYQFDRIEGSDPGAQLLIRPKERDLFR